MEKEGSFEFSVGTRVLVLGCYAGIVVSADAPVFVIRLTQYWSMTPCEALPEAAYQWLRANAIECDCMTSVNYPASMPYTVELCNSYEKLWRVGTQGVQVIPSDAPR